MNRKCALVIAALLLSQCSRDSVKGHDGGRVARDKPRVESDVEIATVSQSFDASGITTVVFRAANASRATIEHTSPDKILVSAKATGGAGGFHSSDPTWRETPAA